MRSVRISVFVNLTDIIESIFSDVFIHLNSIVFSSATIFSSLVRLRADRLITLPECGRGLFSVFISILDLLYDSFFTVDVNVGPTLCRVSSNFYFFLDRYNFTMSIFDFSHDSFEPR